MLGQLLAAHHHGVARAELLGLLDKVDPGFAGQFLPHQFRAIADDDDHPLDARGPQGIEHVAIIGRPQTGTSTLGKSDPIRFPLPAARMIANRCESWSHAFGERLWARAIAATTILHLRTKRGVSPGAAVNCLAR